MKMKAKNKLNKSLKSFAFFVVFIINLILANLYSFAGTSVSSAYKKTVYPGQTVVVQDMLENGTEERSWSASSALTVRYGVTDPWSFDSKINSWQYSSRPSDLGGATISPSSTTGPTSFSEDGYKTTM